MSGDNLSAVVRRRQTVDLPGGKTIELEQLNIKDFAQIREQACSDYKRNLIETYTRNLDLLPEAMRADAVQKAFEKAERITPDDMPKKLAWLPKRDKQGRVLTHSGERFFHEAAGVWIETGGPVLEQQPMEYAGWWLSQTQMGRMYGVWLSMRKCTGQESLTLDAVAKMFTDSLDALGTVADTLGELSQPRLGNESPPAAKTGEAALSG